MTSAAAPNIETVGLFNHFTMGNDNLRQVTYVTVGILGLIIGIFFLYATFYEYYIPGTDPARRSLAVLQGVHFLLVVLIFMESIRFIIDAGWK